MAKGLQDIRRKMKAIRSTRQVTKAMEMVSASKMRRAVEQAQLLRRYSKGAADILRHVSALHLEHHPWLQPRAITHVLIVLCTTDRGQCGSLNAQVLRALQSYLETLSHLSHPPQVSFVAIGKKGQHALRMQNKNIVAAFPAFSNHPTFKDILPLAKFCTDGFHAQTFDHIVLLYPNFISALQQEPIKRILLPLSIDELHQTIDMLQEDDHPVSAYLFEPSASEVLSTILPQLTEVQLYQAILESAASEHSARMVAMRNASDNATDILDELSLTYNQTRQANITAELAELSASKAALS